VGRVHILRARISVHTVVRSNRVRMMQVLIRLADDRSMEDENAELASYVYVF
jgi:hypothetical protein